MIKNLRIHRFVLLWLVSLWRAGLLSVMFASLSSCGWLGEQVHYFKLKQAWQACLNESSGYKKQESIAGCIEVNRLTLEPHLDLAVSFHDVEMKDKSYDGLFEDMDHLVSLSIVGMHVKDIPRSIAGLKNLKFLNLSHNKIEEIPNFLFELKSLRVLLLRANEIESIPSKINEVDRLEVLDIGRNHLTELNPELLGMASLRWLEVDWNKLESFPSDFSGLKSLSVFNASWQQSNIALKELDVSVFASMTNLKVLKLARFYYLKNINALANFPMMQRNESLRGKVKPLPPVDGFEPDYYQEIRNSLMNGSSLLEVATLLKPPEELLPLCRLENFVSGFEWVRMESTDGENCHFVNVGERGQNAN